MRIFDYYELELDRSCPRCERVLSGRQVEDGENALFVWKQGVQQPIGQRVDKGVRLTVEQLARFRLPEVFSMATHCSCSTKLLIEAVNRYCWFVV